MKKNVLVLVIAFLGFQFSQAQENMMSVELQAAIPTGSVFSDVIDAGIGVNFTYYFEEATEDLWIGGRAGYTRFLAADSDFTPDFDFFTIGGSGRYNIGNDLFARLDLGYAIGLESETDGGVFFEPRFGYDTGMLDLGLFYQSISESFVSVNSFGLFVGYKF